MSPQTNLDVTLRKIFTLSKMLVTFYTLNMANLLLIYNIYIYINSENFYLKIYPQFNITVHGLFYAY